MVARKAGEAPMCREEVEERKGKRERRPSHRTRAPRQPRLSYADCSEQLDFNAGINPLPLNFILGE